MSTALDKQARQLAERLVGKGQFYMTQERAMMPGISEQWPETLKAHTSMARLVKVSTETVANEILAFATQVREQTVAEKWVSVAERLPDPGSKVQGIIDHSGYRCIVYRTEPMLENGACWTWRHSHVSEGQQAPWITHWQPLPAPPETTEQEER